MEEYSAALGSLVNQLRKSSFVDLGVGPAFLPKACPANPDRAMAQIVQRWEFSTRCPVGPDTPLLKDNVNNP